MVSIRWYYERTGPGQVAEIVSYTTPVAKALKAHAQERAARAAMLLESKPNVRTGDSQVRVTKGDLDYYVEIADKDSKGGAAGIEKQFGILAEVFS